MSDQTPIPPSSDAAAADGVAQSKNAAKKAAKVAAAAAAKAEKAASGKKVVEDFRLERLAEVERKGFVEAYPHKWPEVTMLPDFRKRYENEEYGPEGGFNEAVTESVAGRCLLSRSAGKDLVFLDLHADEAKIQIIVRRNNYGDAAAFDAAIAPIQRGDIIGVVGHPGRSKSGELSLYATDLKILSPIYHMLPRPEQGLTCEETRKRQRYLDLIVNPPVRQKFYIRSFVIKFIRKFLDRHLFHEVETPILNVIPGGASARPFATHHNELNMPMFMRIAPELYLKMLIIGGMDRVYEIGRQFRNEGIDRTHNPEFTTCEFYWAYKDYNDLMDFTEQMLEEMVIELNNDDLITPVGHPYRGTTIRKFGKFVLDFKRPYPRLRLMEEIDKGLIGAGLGAIPRPYTSDEAQAHLDKACKALKLDFPAPWTTTRMIDRLAEHYVEVKCDQPTFVLDHPVVMTPLAKWNRNDPELTERFELFVAHKELTNAYTELNCPQIQRERFMEQMKDRAAGDAEAQPIDEGFCTALEYALPPTAGWGLGVDRLAMFLSDADKIQDVLLFPTLRPEEEANNAAAAK